MFYVKVPWGFCATRDRVLNQTTPLDIEKAIDLLQAGEVVGMPTETVYGLAACVTISSAIEKIFSTKERPFFDPLIVHVSSVEQAKTLTLNWGPVAQALSEAFWPGPLTMVVPKADSVNTMITSGLDSVGIRMPAHPLALELIEGVGIPLAAPSANKFGRTSPTSADHVRKEFAEENIFVVDGGPCEIGIESTVLLLKEQIDQPASLSILRRGYVLQADIEDALKARRLSFKFTESVSKKESPGHMKHHYMPALPFIICEDPKRAVSDILKEVNARLPEIPDEIESIRILKPKDGLKAPARLLLSTDPVIAAREFYSRLRDLAETAHDSILFIREPHQTGERWESLFDRVYKAATLVLN